MRTRISFRLGYAMFSSTVSLWCATVPTPARNPVISFEDWGTGPEVICSERGPYPTEGSSRAAPDWSRRVGHSSSGTVDIARMHRGVEPRFPGRICPRSYQPGFFDEATE